MRRSVILILAVFSCAALLAFKNFKNMKMLPELANDRLQVKCDDTCTDEEKQDLVVAAKWLNQHETPGSCFDKKFRAIKNIDQRRWVLDNPGKISKTVDQIALDLTSSPAESQISVMRIPPWNLGRRWFYKNMCAEESNDGSVSTVKNKCFDGEGYREKAMTLAHELSHRLNYEHDGNHELGNEHTVPYLTQYVVCECWKADNGPIKPGVDSTSYTCHSTDEASSTTP